MPQLMKRRWAERKKKVEALVTPFLISTNIFAELMTAKKKKDVPFLREPSMPGLNLASA